MAHSFHYDSRDHHQAFNRTQRFGFFVGALGLVAGAFSFVHLYFTEWSHAEDTLSNRTKLLVAILLGFAALVCVAIVAGKLFRQNTYPNYQFIHLENEKLKWHFSQSKAPVEIDLDQVKYAMTDPRHIIFKMQDGEEIWMENYLVVDEGEWDSFLRVLREVVEVKI